MKPYTDLEAYLLEFVEATCNYLLREEQSPTLRIIMQKERQELRDLADEALVKGGRP